MKLSVPTNWDDGLIETFSGARVDEVYGKLASDIVGGGRAAYLSTFVSRGACARHIRMIRVKGISFNYLLNSTCLDNREWTRGWQNSLARFLDWLALSGVDRLTVSVPYLLELIKKKYPQFKVGISIGAHVDSVARAKSWLGLGADSLTLSDVRVNRDFELIKAIRAAVGCELKLIANNACLRNCPFSFHHSVFNAHASGSCAGKSIAIDYNRFKCRHLCFSDPVMFLKTTWIRPEDLDFYHSLGVDTFKLVDRVMSTEMLKRVITAYVLRRYEGDMTDLILGKSYKERYSFLHIFSRARFFFYPFKVNLILLGKALLNLENCAVHIDNSKLNGFVQHLYEIGCNALDCGKCRFCDRKAAEALKYDENERLRALKSHDDLLKALLSGRCFDYFSGKRALRDTVKGDRG